MNRRCHYDAGGKKRYPTRLKSNVDEAADLQDALEGQARAWDDRPLLRRQYASFYSRIVAHLSPESGQTVELGSGIGSFKNFKPDAITTDVETTRWSDRVVDAHELPFDDGSIANLVLLDVFHHLESAPRFLNEARRVLALGGRVVLIDPYCSALSTPIYRFIHHESAELSADPFTSDPQRGKAPLESNQALATLVFYRGRQEYQARSPELPIVAEERFAFLVYPLTGGFTRRPLLPKALYEPLQVIEQALRPLARFLAFRCLVVLERR